MPPKGEPTTPSAQKRKGTQNSGGPSSKRRKPTMTEQRQIHIQSSSSLPKDGAVDSINLSTFLSAREFEIKALANSMKRSKDALTTRAFQQVPRDLRRRTASHNVKRVPARLRERARREMREDNTPTVKQGSKMGSSRSRIRAETAKRLGILAGKKRAGKLARTKEGENENELLGRLPIPKARKGALSKPPKPKSKFRKRQIHKTWLPTHLWHAKRSTMTEPKNPMWRFALPLTPTEKSYRPTHRAGGARGALCWDMSYMSTIGLEGSDLALEKVLRCIGITDDRAWGHLGQRWRDGKRSWSGWTTKDVKGHRRAIGPVTVFWQAQSGSESKHIQQPSDVDEIAQPKKEQPNKRQLMIRVHPSIFLEVWNELLRFSKQQRPVVHVEDLRFEIGSISIMGPGSTEALLGILQPFKEDNDHARLFQSLAGISNASSLPANALLTFSILDPRLRYPPRRYPLPDPSDPDAAFSLLETLAKWPADIAAPSTDFFDRQKRYIATRLPSQKAINRRKGKSAPGEFPKPSSIDPEIPIMLLTSRGTSPSSSQGSYTLLAPWKCILPIWYGIVHYPLSTGTNPRHGGLRELQQIAFEHEQPWFPADFPGTDAGWAWELEQRRKRKTEWERRPRGKRTAYESLDLGFGRKGEVGLPWGADFEYLLCLDTVKTGSQTATGESLSTETQEKAKIETTISPLLHVSKVEFLSTIKQPSLIASPNAVAAIRITLVSKGVPQAGARVYRLPAATSLATVGPESLRDSDRSTASVNSTSQKPKTLPSDIRQQCLRLLPLPSEKKAKKSKFFQPNGLRQVPVSRPASLEERKRSLAVELLKQPALVYPMVKEENPHPSVPNEEDLVGFVTTGNFNLAEGRGTAIGSILISKVVGLDCPGNEKRICVVRNVGETVGRLGIWEAI